MLEYDRFAAGLEAGVAAHHAGMVPPFKEAVEACFAEGLVKVVFATETLALGINMPARSVVIESLSKFTGERHEDLTPGQYTQLTGRAGRRGIDPVGHAIVLWSPFVPFDRVAALAASRDFPLTLGLPSHVQHGRQPRAALRVRRGAPPAQPVVRPVPGGHARWSASRPVERLASPRSTRSRRDARCELGDVEEYRALLKADDLQPPRPADGARARSRRR